MSIYDVLFIGTGPISVIDACQHSSMGQKVLMVDDKTTIGGAWTTIPFGDYGEYEIGCHIWSYHKRAYQFMSTLDMDLVELNPAPSILKGKKEMSYDHKNALHTARVLTHHAKKLTFGQALKFIRQDPAARLPIIPKPYLYPKGGAREFRDRLQEMLNESKVECLMGVKMRAAAFNDGLWKLTTADEELIQARHVVLTSASELQEIRVEEHVLSVVTQEVQYIHVHILLSKQPTRHFSYVRILDDPLIHRISDISYQMEHASSTSSLLLVGVHDQPSVHDLSTEELTAAIMLNLKRRGYYAETVEVIFSQQNTFDTKYIDGQQRAKIAKLHPSLRILSTTDLMYGVARHLDSWQS